MADTNKADEPERRAYLLYLTDYEMEGARAAVGSAHASNTKGAAQALAWARPMTDEDLREIGMGALRRDYYGSCESIARDAVDEAIEQAREGLAADEPTDWDDVREFVDEYVHERVDSSGWVLYTADAMDVLRISDNDGAVEEYGTDGILTDAGINWSLLAFYAMRADVMEKVEDMLREAEDAEDERLANPETED